MKTVYWRDIFKDQERFMDMHDLIIFAPPYIPRVFTHLKSEDGFGVPGRDLLYTHLLILLKRLK